MRFVKGFLLMNIELPFPFLGLNTGEAVDKQPLYTSGHLNNVRPYDVMEIRKRGGQRPGLDKKYSEQIGTQGFPVVAMTEITMIT